MSAREQWILVLLFATGLLFGVGSLKPDADGKASQGLGVAIFFGVGIWAIVEIVLTYG